MLCFTNSHFKLCQQKRVTVKMQQEFNRTREDRLQIATDQARQPMKQEMDFRAKNIINLLLH